MFSDYTVGAEVTEDGRLELDDRPAFSRAMTAFKRGRVTVRIEVDRGKRSTQQNRYYRLILGLISDHTGDEPEYLHDFFKKKFNPVAFSFGHEDDVIGGSTALMNYDDFWKYVDKIRQFVLEEPCLNIVTPEPDPALRGKSRHAKRSAA